MFKPIIGGMLMILFGAFIMAIAFIFWQKYGTHVKNNDYKKMMYLATVMNLLAMGMNLIAMLINLWR
jgi:uncharacterized phage-associated protein